MDNFDYVAFGFDESDCPLPCEVYSTEARLTTSANSKELGVGFILQIPLHIEVREAVKYYSTDLVRKGSTPLTLYETYVKMTTGFFLKGPI